MYAASVLLPTPLFLAPPVPTRSSERAGIHQPKKREGSGGISSTYIYIWWEGVQEIKPDSFQWHQWQEKRQWAQIYVQKVPLKHEVFLTVKLVKHWHRLPRKVVDFPCLEIIKTWMEAVLASLHQLILSWVGR